MDIINPGMKPRMDVAPGGGGGCKFYCGCLGWKNTCDCQGGMWCGKHTVG